MPHILPFSFGEEILNEGDTASVSCVATKGDMPIGLTFYHNNIPVIDENGVVIMKSAKMIALTIENVRADHQGNYTCRASNRAGQAEYTADLNINGYFLYYTHKFFFF